VGFYYFYRYPQTPNVMKLLNLYRPLMICLGFCMMLISCTKPNSNCSDPISLTIDHNGPLYPGWPLYLEADIQSTAYLYKWSGPNGWKKDYQIFSSDAYHQEILNVTAAEAGEYKLRLIDTEGCVAYEGSTTVEVLTAPTVPCTVAANTSTSSVVGVGDFTFVNRSFSGGGGYYMVSGSQVVGGHYMRFAFLGDTPPLPGVYKTSGFFSHEPGDVGLYIETITHQFVANPDQSVYVNKVNNKLEVTFCAVKFNNPINPASPITISAKIVQP
jgi:hypothetical protein